MTGDTLPPITDAGHRGGIPGVVVTLTDSSGVVVATTTTNETGEYRFGGLSEGTYMLAAHSSQHDPVAQAVTVRNGTAVTHDLELGGLCELTGIVRAAAPSTSPTTQRAAPDAALDVLTTRRGRPAEEAEQQATRRDDDGGQPSPRRRRRGLVWMALGVVLMAAAGAGIWLWATDTSAEPAPAATGPQATAVVERGTIAATESWEGTLDHGTPFTVTAGTEGERRQEDEPGGEGPEQGAGGTITRLVDQGETIARGGGLYRVNEQRVTLMYGAVPMYRDLGPGDSGADVEQLETNLAELGYDGFTVDDEYNESTAEEVRAWQSDKGAAQTGTVARGDVVFVPGFGQVAALHADVGDVVSLGTPILDITATEQAVSLEVDVDDRDRFNVDTEVTVDLPGGDEVPGTVSTMAVVDVAPDDAGEGFEGGTTDTESIAEVEVTLDEQVADDLIGATVDVIVAIDERTDVLVVPVNALLALAEGGYGLEIVADDGTTEIVAVDTGLFADGTVEIDSADITEGMVVGVAGR